MCTLTLISPHWVTKIQHQHRCKLFLRPSTFITHDCSFFSFWIVHFDPFVPSTSGLLERLRSALMTAQFSCFRPSSVFLSDRPLFDFRVVHFDPRPSTLDRTRFLDECLLWYGIQNDSCLKVKKYLSIIW